jgi:L-lactate dehydrogenase complex protein LldG
VAVARVSGDAAREVVLARVRAALAPGPAATTAEAAPAVAVAPGPVARPVAADAIPPAPVAIPRTYRQAGRASDPEEVVERFCERVAEYHAQVHRVSPAELDAFVAGMLANRRVVVPAAPPCTVRGFNAVFDDPPLTPHELDGPDAVLTGCALAVAQTGTVVLDGSAACGRRAITLVPDRHVCVVRAGQIVPDVPDAIAALRRIEATRRPITLISGPSATSDIELERVEGVHGPRLLELVVVSEGPSDR